MSTEAATFWWWLGASAVAVVWCVLAERRKRDAWRQVASKFGLVLSNGVATGRHQGRGICVQEFEEGSGDERTTWLRLTVEVGTRCGNVALRRRQGGDRGWVDLAPVETGDEAFDSKLDLRGDPAAALALLPQRTRALLLRDLPARTRLEGGAIVLTEPGSLRAAPPAIALLEQCLACANALHPADPDVSMLLARNARADLDQEVRLRNLEALAKSFPNSAPLRWAAAEARAAGDARTRLVGAMAFASPAAFASVVQLVGAAGELDGEWRARGLNHLLGAYPQADLRAVVEQALDSGVEPLQRAAAKAVGSPGHALPRGQAYTEPLAPRTQALLVRLLLGASEACRLEAVGALGQRGALDAVEPLLPLTKGLLRSRASRHAARDAIRRIQERTGGKGGGLSVAAAGEVAGGLSVPRLEGALADVAPAGRT